MLAKRKYLIILIMLVSKITCGQEASNSGLPILSYFPYNEYNANPQNWDILQSHDGKMYFANGEGILEFDGNWWRLIELPNKTIVRSLAISKAGTIYVGGYEEFGFLKENKIGQLEYKSLIDLLPDNFQYFQDVWTTKVVDDEVFFQTTYSIFVLKDSTIREYTTDGFYVWGSTAHNHYFTHDLSSGLDIYIDGEFKNLNGTERFKKESIFNVLDYKNDLYVLATSNSNIYICDIDTAQLKLEVINSVNNSTTEFLKNNLYYTGVNYNNENFCFSTYYGGFLLCDMSFQPILNMSKSFGLDNNNIIDIYKDHNNNIWLAMDRGITLVNMDLSITFLNKFSNVTGSINDAIVYDDSLDNIPKRLYIASIEGVFYKDLDKKSDPLEQSKYQKFLKYRNFREETWCLYEFNNSLLCASSFGTYEIKNNTTYHISWSPAWSFTPVKGKPNTLIVNLDNGLEIIKYDKGKWKLQNKVAGSQGYISSSIFDEDENLWVESTNEGVYKLKLSKDLDTLLSKQSYSTNKGLPSPTLNYPYLLGNELRITTEKGIYKYNKKEDKFIPDKYLNQNIGNVSPDFIFQAPNKNIWYYSSKKKSLGELIYQKNNKYIKDTAHFNDIRNLAIQNMYFYNDSIIFFCSSNGLIVYNKNKRKKRQESIHTHIFKVEITNDPDSVYMIRNKASKDSMVTLSFKQNAIRFSFAATSYVNAYKNQFSYYLEGFNKKGRWSDWTSQPVKEYNYLKEGEYVLHIKSRDLHMNVGNTLSYHFEVLPPFYRTITAYVLYIILIALLLYILALSNSRRLRLANIKLENKVIDRTKEVYSQKKKITDSIEYALQIQKAILPTYQSIKEITQDLFIYYNPKDIVSGDFYWYNKNEESHFFATVDCTGHGVPGAFMSMIGNTLLNEIVIHEGILHPAKILETMNLRLKSILKQDKKDNSANSDGMDVSIIKFDKKYKVLTIASAIHSVIIIDNDELKHIQGDLYEIGGFHSDSVDFEITEHLINYSKGCLVYMFTDGFTDQFGGSPEQKYTIGKFEELLLKIKDLPMDQQKEELEKAFNKWKGDNKQIDDVTVIGFKL